MTATQAMDEIFGGVCFTGDTLILTDKGNEKGDRVYSKNLETNEIEIKTTREHPFYVENKGFVKAEEIKKDDILVSEKGKEKVEGTEKKKYKVKKEKKYITLK